MVVLMCVEYCIVVGPSMIDIDAFGNEKRMRELRIDR